MALGAIVALWPEPQSKSASAGNDSRSEGRWAARGVQRGVQRGDDRDGERVGSHPRARVPEG